MFTTHSALVITSIFSIVILFAFASLGIHKAIEILKKSTK